MSWGKLAIKTLGLTVIGLLAFGALTPLRVSAASPGEVGSWTTSSHPIPANKAYPATAVHNGFVYVLGGYGGAQDNIYYAPIASDGSVGGWTSSNTLPISVSGAMTVINDGHIYLIGGYTNTYSDLVYSAPINVDGSIGAWTSQNSLPHGVLDAGSAIFNDYVYISGGNDGFADQDGVYYAHLNSDGTLGTWHTSSNSLPQGLNAPSSVAHNGYLYVSGGINTGVTQPTVYYAHLNSDGSVGSWITASNPMPHGLALHSFVEYNGYLFVFGGYDGGVTSGVYSAPLMTDGSVGSWSTSPNSLPQTLYGSGYVAYNGRVYLFGGVHSGPTSNVYYASLTGFSAPTVTSMTSSAISGSSVTVDVTSNATGSPNPTTLRVVSGPSHGSAQTLSGKVIYTPDSGFGGQDSLVFELCSINDADLCSQATLTFSVTAATAPSTGLGPATHSDQSMITLAGIVGVILTIVGLIILPKKNSTI